MFVFFLYSASGLSGKKKQVFSTKSEKDGGIPLPGHCVLTVDQWLQLIGYR